MLKWKKRLKQRFGFKCHLYKVPDMRYFRTIYVCKIGTVSPDFVVRLPNFRQVNFSRIFLLQISCVRFYTKL
jgi:hypothetical protein